MGAVQVKAAGLGPGALVLDRLKESVLLLTLSLMLVKEGVVRFSCTRPELLTTRLLVSTDIKPVLYFQRVKLGLPTRTLASSWV